MGRDGQALAAGERELDRRRGGRDLTSVDQDALRLGITRYVTKSRTSEAEFVGHVRELLAGLNEARALREGAPPDGSSA